MNKILSILIGISSFLFITNTAVAEKHYSHYVRHNYCRSRHGHGIFRHRYYFHYYPLYFNKCYNRLRFQYPNSHLDRFSHHYKYLLPSSSYYWRDSPCGRCR